jgi:hypothetical protein
MLYQRIRRDAGIEPYESFELHEQTKMTRMTWALVLPGDWTESEC